MYAGPAWIGDEGMPFLVLIAHDQDWPRRLRVEDECAFVAWRWPDSPSAYFSVDPDASKWISAPSCPVDASKRRSGSPGNRRGGRFISIVVNALGQHSGWYEASFGEKVAEDTSPSRQGVRTSLDVLNRRNLLVEHKCSFRPAMPEGIQGKSRGGNSPVGGTRI